MTATPSRRPRLSVIVALGPHHLELPPAVSSALGAMHGFEDAELVVMDDEAPAAVREQLARLEGPRRVRHNLTGWFGIRGALAAGATCAEGEVLIFLAAEAQLAKGALEQICAAFDADPGVALVHASPAGLGAIEDGGGTAPVVALRKLALTSIGGSRALFHPSAPGDLADSDRSEPPMLSPGSAPLSPRRGAEEQQHLLHPGIVPALLAAGWRRSAAALLEEAVHSPLTHWGPVEPDARALSRPSWVPVAVPPRPRPGINVIGLLEAACGIGDAARRYTEAIARSGLPYATYAYHGHGSPLFPYEHQGPRDFPFDLNLIALNADTLPALAWNGGPELWLNRYSVGMWFWELEELSASIMAGFRFVNELWVSTRFLEKAFSAHTDKKVLTVPLPVRRRDGQPTRDRSALGLPEAFTFLTIFDFGSVALRKNSLGVIRAFKTAFDPGEGPVLVLKTLNASWDRAGMRDLEAEIAGRRDIVVLDGYLSDEVISEMAGSADCFVSLHRSEGFGLTPAEAMAWGRPVIATGYSGNLEFMTESNSYLVDFDRTGVPNDLAPVYPTGSHWAEPRLAHAASLMRHVYEQPEEAAARGARAQSDIRRTNSLDAAQRVIARRIEEIARSRRAPRPGARPTPGNRSVRRPVAAGHPR
jgi:glycosyltransferase involved in cell wall biosynthesis